jgi:hypothetical protein
METINQTESDLENKILLIIKNTQHLQDCTKSALDAIAFNDFHEGMHIGVIMSLQVYLGVLLFVNPPFHTHPLTFNFFSES